MSDTPPATSPASSLAALSTQGRALWAKLPARARTAAIGSTVAIVALVGYLMLSGGGGGSWHSVTDGLTPLDAKELIGALNASAIPSRLKGTSVVEVPSARLAEARAAAVVARVPRSQEGLEMLKRSALGTSSEREKQQYVAALQGELGHAISTLGPIDGARVNLQFGKQSVIAGNAIAASASVQLRVRTQSTLKPDQVRGIKLVVVGAVTGLDLAHVFVVDQDANPLSDEGNDSANQQSTEESRLADSVRTLLETLTGVGKVKVMAHIEFDRRTVNTIEDKFTDPKILSQILATAPGAGATTATTAASGITGTTGNLPGAPAATTGSVATAGPVVSSTTNNQFDHLVTQTAEPTTRVARVSVVVLLADGVDEDGEPVARTPEELAKVTAIAHTAAGLDDARGDKLTVEAMTFVEPEVAVIVPVPAHKLPVPLPLALGGGAVVLIAAVFVLGRRRRKAANETTVRIALPAPVAELERALAAPMLGDAAGPPALPPGRSLEERVVGAVKGDVQRASRVLASWLAEPDPIPVTPHGKSARA